MFIRPQNIYSLNNPGNPIILKILVQTTLRLTHKKHIRFLKLTHKGFTYVLPNLRTHLLSSLEAHRLPAAPGRSRLHLKVV